MLNTYDFQNTDTERFLLPGVAKKVVMLLQVRALTLHQKAKRQRKSLSEETETIMSQKEGQTILNTSTFYSSPQLNNKN